MMTITKDEKESSVRGWKVKDVLFHVRGQGWPL